MNQELKHVLIIVGIASLVLYVTMVGKKPKSVTKKSYSPPAEADTKDKEVENAFISIKAYRDAINDNAPQSELDSLNRDILRDYNIKVYKIDGLLEAKNRKGETIAMEQK